MKHFISLLAVLLLPAGAWAQGSISGNSGAATATAPPGSYSNGSQALPASATQVFAAPGGPPRVRIKLLNLDPTIAIWCRWGTVAGAPAAVSGVGSFLLPAGGGGIDDQGAGVNQSALNCIAASGTPNLYAEQY
jgi:hypothetical protein